MAVHAAMRESGEATPPIGRRRRLCGRVAHCHSGRLFSGGLIEVRSTVLPPEETPANYKGATR